MVIIFKEQNNDHLRRVSAEGRREGRTARMVPALQGARVYRAAREDARLRTCLIVDSY